MGRIAKLEAALAQAIKLIDDLCGGKGFAARPVAEFRELLDHGYMANKRDRKAYMREYMRKRREKKAHGF